VLAVLGVLQVLQMLEMLRRVSGLSRMSMGHLLWVSIQRWSMAVVDILGLLLSSITLLLGEHLRIHDGQARLSAGGHCCSSEKLRKRDYRGCSPRSGASPF
jgi:hypothetical protein